MSAAADIAGAGGAAVGSARPGWLRLLIANRLASLGLAVLLLIACLALATPFLPLQDPAATALSERLLPVGSPSHWLGTDQLGRDILSRILWGTRISIAVGLSATAIAAVFGSLIGLIAGYFGGRTDTLLMRSIDMLMAFPYILLALAIVAVLGPGLLNALYAIAVVNIPFFARNVRGVTRGLAHREFVDAARLSGKGHVAILATEVLPNVMPVIVIAMSSTVGWMIVETAGLSFLGLGAQPPQADLGSMLGDGRSLLFNAPHVSVIPGLAIFVLVISINLVGDGIRDVLDPRLRSGALARPSARTSVERHAMPPMPAADPGKSISICALETEFRVGGAVYRAVGGVDLELRREECLGLVGESGSGKSVTALSILSLVPTPPGAVVGGRVTFEDRDLFELSDATLRDLRGGKIAMVFQDPQSSLHPLMAVGDQIAEAIRAHQATTYAEALERATALLDLVRIPNARQRVNAYPHELSGGMRQRVCIAMAVANKPEVIIADEPTTALDVTVQAEVLSLLNELRRESGAAVLFITHDFGVVSEVCDRVAVMYAGHIVETGPADEVVARPAHPYTAKLIDCVPILGEADRRIDPIHGMPPALDQLPPGCAFADRCPQMQPDCRSGEIKLDDLGGGRAARCLYPLVRETP